MSHLDSWVQILNVLLGTEQGSKLMYHPVPGPTVKIQKELGGAQEDSGRALRAPLLCCRMKDPVPSLQGTDTAVGHVP